MDVPVLPRFFPDPTPARRSAWLEETCLQLARSSVRDFFGLGQRVLGFRECCDSRAALSMHVACVRAGRAKARSFEQLRP